MMYSIDTRRLSQTDCCGQKQDCCPTCGGLTCLDRPRFFAGQLLTEAELNSEQAYVLAKNRLHNRYLHGYGIVCGLQVSCHDCQGWVTVHPGYALDACGNDILVCAPYDFDLIKAIRDCRDMRRRPADCDPWRQPVDKDCQNLEEDWLVTIRYKEKEGQPTTALVSCSPTTCGCESGNGGSRQAQKTSAGRTSRSANLGACEPSRIIESFEICVAPLPPEDPEKRPNALQRIIEWLERLGITVDTTVIMGCITRFQAFAARWANLLRRTQENPFGERLAIARDLCRLRDDLRDELLNHARTQCGLLDLLAQVYCPPAPQTDNGIEQFVGQVTTALGAMAQIMIQHLVECLCFAILPTCPPDVCDDRLALAHVTVQGDRIVRICHTDVRRYVLTPHTLVPALVSLVLDQVCCAELRLFEFDRLTTANSFSSATFAHVASASTPINMTANLVQNLRRAGFADFAQTPADQVETATFVGQPINAVRATLENTAPQVETVQVKWSPAEALRRSVAMPAIRPGEPLRVFVDENDRIIGFDQESESLRLRRELNDANDRLSRLESRLEEALKATGGGSTTKRSSAKRGQEKG